MAKRHTNGMAVELVGADELGKQFQALANVGKADLLEAIVKAVAEPVRKLAEDRAPRNTGELAGNIIAETLVKRQDVCVVGIGPSKDAWHGIFQELGTSHHGAQPFLRPSFDERKEESKTGIADGLKEAIEEAVDK